MVDERRLQQCLENMIDSGKSPEEVCDGDPELLDELRSRWERVHQVRLQIVELFPTPDPTRRKIATPLSCVGAGLPVVPGYVVESVVGYGGVGVVYQARHAKLNRLVAMKMLLSGVYAGPSELTRFAREAEAVAALQHPNIVQIYDVGALDGRPYFTMEFIEGGSLAQKLAGVPRPPREAAELIGAIAPAVHASHLSGIIHRDLKPANILLTLDGTPKITDFGLARRVEHDVGLTVTDTRIGTPSYMSPEQALCKPEEIGPASDVYALGAVLYEMLTGRPPFHGTSAVETLRQVVSHDPVPPSSLVPCVPRDLETICMKCLRKDLGRRYGSAAELADDIGRFQRGEPILARRTGRAERAAKWVRRRPSAATAIAAAAVVVILVAGGAAWLGAARSANNAAVAEDLREAARLQARFEWAPAIAAMDRAALRLGAGGPAELRRQLERTRRDSTLVARLDEIRGHNAASVGGIFSTGRVDGEYEQAFRDAGLGTEPDAPAAVAARVMASNVRFALVGALDDWTSSAPTSSRQKWILAVALQADADPSGWRDRIRTSAVWNDAEALVKATSEATVGEVAGQPVAFLLAVESQLNRLRRDPLSFTTKVQQAHPSDFFANMRAGMRTEARQDHTAALGYFQAGLAIRPDTAIANHNVGMLLCNLSRKEDGVIRLREALKYDPGSIPTRSSLGMVLSQVGHLDEGIAELRTAIHDAPDDSMPYRFLGQVLATAGRNAEALEQLQLSLARKPTGNALATLRQSLRVLFNRLGRTDEALAVWKEELAAKPNDRGVWDGYPEFCLLIGREPEYQEARVSLLRAFGDDANPRICETVARTCLLRSTSTDQLRRVNAMIDRALASEPALEGGYIRFYLFAKGLALYRGGEFEPCLTILSGKASTVLGPSPALVAAMAQWRLGRHDEARQTLARALRSYNWAKGPREGAQAWMYVVLRHEAEAMIGGSPGDVTERGPNPARPDQVEASPN